MQLASRQPYPVGALDTIFMLRYYPLSEHETETTRYVPRSAEPFRFVDCFGRNVVSYYQPNNG